MKWLLLAFWIVFGLWLTGCQKDINQNSEKGFLKIQLTHTAANQPLTLNTAISNSFGESLTVTRYKYYISNITLTDERDNRRLLPDTYFLVDEGNAASKTLEMEVPVGNYKAISFLVGVDSTRNVSGAQSGALDPLHDMFWTWNTGYIMAKLEGTSPASNLPNNKVEYHIGGFKGEHAALRTVHFPFGSNYKIEKSGRLQVAVSADILKWFDGAYALTIAAAPTATAPGALAARFADNYSRMFTLTSVQPQ